MKRLIFIIAFIAYGAGLYSQTNVGGTILSNTTWTLSGSPYTLTSVVGVANGVTLTIEPGVVVNSNSTTDQYGNPTYFDLLIKGDLIANGTSASNISVTNTRILFKSTNLSNSNVSYIAFNNCGVQLADESEHNQDPIKNSGTLNVNNCSFVNGSYAYTKGYGTSANLVVENSTFDNSTIKGYYPRSEAITVTNCDIDNSVINSDSYNYGITISNCDVDYSQFTIGCCGANINVRNSKVHYSPFYDYNNYYTVRIESSELIQSPMRLESGDVFISNSYLYFNSDNFVDFPYYIKSQNLREFGVKARRLELTNSIIIGNEGGVAVEVNRYGYDSYLSKISNSTISSSETAIIVHAGQCTIEKVNFNQISTNTIINNSKSNITAQYNYWGTTNESEISAKIYDMYDDINSGIVNYSNYLSSPAAGAPITSPINVTKGLLVSGGVQINWYANKEPDLKGYKVYYKSSIENNYSNYIDVGKVTSFTTTSIDYNSDFVVTAYDSIADGVDDVLEGHESSFSEVAKSQKGFHLVNGSLYCSVNDFEYQVYASNDNALNYDLSLYLSNEPNEFSEAVVLQTIDTLKDVTYQQALPDTLTYGQEYYVTIKYANDTYSESSVIVLNKTPSAAFSIDSDLLCDLETTFVNHTEFNTPSATYTWDFDGANILAGLNQGPYELNWNSEGQKKISLTIEDKGCYSDTYVDSINVYSTPSSDFYVPNYTCGIDSVYLNYLGESKESLSFNWNQGSAQVTADTSYQDYFLNWPQIGYDTITLFVENNGCVSDTTKKVIEIRYNPVSSFEIDTNRFCQDQTLNAEFSGTANETANFNWLLDGGALESGIDTIEAKWNKAGSKSVGLVVSDNGCISDTVEKAIEVLDVPIANFELPNLVCGNDSVNLIFTGKVNNQANFNWNFGNALIKEDSVNAKYRLAWGETGSKTISLSIVQNGCYSDTVSKSISAYIKPTSIFETDTNLVCGKDTLDLKYLGNATNLAKFKWSFDGATIVTDSIFGEYQITWNKDGYHPISLFVEENGCKSETSIKEVGYFNPGATISLIDKVCEGDTVEVFYSINASDSVKVSWDWNDGDVLVDSLNHFAVKWEQNPGFKNVIMSLNDNGCVNSIKETLLNGNVPSMSFIGNGNACFNTASEIIYTGDASDSATYYWTVLDKDISYMDSLVTLDYWWTESGVKNISLTVTDNGCIADSAFTLTVNEETQNIPICLSSVAGADNILVWEHINNPLYDSVFVYKKNDELGRFDKIASVQASEANMFIDSNTDINEFSSEYRIATFDTCGYETELSQSHKTMNLKIYNSVNGALNLIWNKYEGIDYSNFIIYRGTSTNNLQPIAEQASNTFTFTDLNVPAGELFYQIGVEKTTGCEIIASTLDTPPFDETRSNIVSSTSVGMFPIKDNAFKVYPNPVEGILYLTSNYSLKEGELSVYSVDGKKLISKELKMISDGLDVSELSPDIYIIELRTKEIVGLKKFVKE